MLRPGKREKSSASSSDGAPTPLQTKKGSSEVLADPTNMAAEEHENLEEEVIVNPSLADVWKVLREIKANLQKLGVVQGVKKEAETKMS